MMIGKMRPTCGSTIIRSLSLSCRFKDRLSHLDVSCLALLLERANFMAFFLPVKPLILHSVLRTVGGDAPPTNGQKSTEIVTLADEQRRGSSVTIENLASLLYLEPSTVT